MTAHAGPVHSGSEMGRAKAVWSRVENTDSITESWLRSWADDCQGLSLHCFSCKMEIIVVPTSPGTPLQYSCLENPMETSFVYMQEIEYASPGISSLT